MNTQQTKANRQADGFKWGRLSFLNTVFILALFLAAFAPQAEAVAR